MGIVSSIGNNITFLTASSHFFSALAIVMIAAYYWKKKGAVIAAIIFTIYALFKEFWYDINYEVPKQTWQDAAFDFIYYMAGVVVALFLVLFINTKTTCCIP